MLGKEKGDVDENRYFVERSGLRGAGTGFVSCKRVTVSPCRNEV
jgi:hypothetical protein